MGLDLELDGRVALITGGGRGIGRSIALALARQGASVALCGRTAASLESTADELRALGVRAWPVVADVSRREDVDRFVDEASRAAGRVDILVNNAVTSHTAPFDEQTDDHWRYHIDVKLLAYIRCARGVLPHMQRGRFGRIVNIGGMTARIVAPLRMTNGVVNAGVADFTKQFANHVAPHNVTVNCVHPGTTATDRMLQNLRREANDAGIPLEERTAQAIAEIPMGRLIEPEDIARAVLFFCSPLASIVTGQCIAVDGGSAMSVNY